MRSKLVWLVAILIVIASVFSMVGKTSTNTSEFKPLEINPGDEFTYIDYGNTMYVLNYIMEDVNGDNTKDMVIAIGEKADTEDLEYNNIDVVVFEPVEGKFHSLKLKKFNGKMPTIYVQELTGDGILDIVITAQEKNLSLRIVSYNGKEFKEIFKQRDNKGLVFAGSFIDGFKAYIKNTQYKKEANIDLQDRKENYITSQFYDDSGRLLKDGYKISTTGFCAFDLVQLDNYYGIQTTQRIIGFSEDDLIDEIKVIWKYEDGKWNVKEAKGLNIGNILY